MDKTIISYGHYNIGVAESIKYEHFFSTSTHVCPHYGIIHLSKRQIIDDVVGVGIGKDDGGI